MPTPTAKPDLAMFTGKAFARHITADETKKAEVIAALATIETLWRDAHAAKQAAQDTYEKIVTLVHLMREDCEDCKPLDGRTLNAKESDKKEDAAEAKPASK